MSSPRITQRIAGSECACTSCWTLCRTISAALSWGARCRPRSAQTGGELSVVGQDRCCHVQALFFGTRLVCRAECCSDSLNHLHLSLIHHDEAVDSGRWRLSDVNLWVINSGLHDAYCSSTYGMGQMTEGSRWSGGVFEKSVKEMQTPPTYV